MKTIVKYKIAGKVQSIGFSNEKTARDFVTMASAKFGGKFKVIAAPMPPREQKPATSGMSDIGAGSPTFKGRGDLAEDAEFYKGAGSMNFSPSNVPSQVLQSFYPELQHELISYPNVNNAPMMGPEISGDIHSTPEYNEGDLPDSIEDVFSTMSRIGYVSTAPAAAAGIGRDGKPQVLEGAPLVKDDEIRGPQFIDSFYQNYGGIAGAAITLASKTAGQEDKEQFALFLKRVMGEVAASFIAAFKVTSRLPLNKVPGVGEIQLALVEQPLNSAFNVVNSGSRVKALLNKLTDSQIQECVNSAFAQGAVWHEGNEMGSFVYEVFVRAETVDLESMILKYRYVVGTKEAE